MATTTEQSNKALVLEAFDTLFNGGLRRCRTFLVAVLHPT